MSLSALASSAQSLAADLHYLLARLRRLENSPQVRANPNLTLYLSFLAYFYQDRKAQTEELLQDTKKRNSSPLTTIRQKIDVEDRAIDLLERLVEVSERSGDVPNELYFVLQDVFKSFQCKIRFVVLSGVSLSTLVLEDLIPEVAIPHDVKAQLEKEFFAVIFAPPRFTKNPEYWPRIVHEAAHNIDRLLKITGNTIQGFGKGVAKLPLELARSVVSLCQEQVADLISIHYYGPAYGDSALLVFLRGEPVVLPTHPIGTQRLLTIASELEYMGFEKESKDFREKTRQLGVEEKHRDKAYSPPGVAKPLQNKLRANVRSISLKCKSILSPSDVASGVRMIGKFVEYDLTNRRFVKLTPANLPLRILFNSYRPRLKGRAQTNFEESQEIHEWILNSIRMSATAESPAFRDFYVAQPVQIR